MVKARCGQSGGPFPWAIPGVVDGHSHIFCGDGYVERLLETADSLGISRICVSGHRQGAWNLLTNEGILAAAEKYPERLIPFAFVQLGDEGPEAVRQAVRRGFRGVKFIAPLVGYDDERAYSVYEAVADAGLPAHFHCGVVAYERGLAANSEFMRPMRLDPVARRFPDMPMLLSHLGVPEYEVATTLARIIPNIFVDITGNPRGGWCCSKTPEFIKSLFYWPGWHRKLIFGTDVRWELMGEAIEMHTRMLSALDVSKDMACAIYRDNFRRFVGETVEPPVENSEMRPG